MNKAQCLQKANDYKNEANIAQNNVTQLVAIFGGSDALVVSAMNKVNDLQEQAATWERIAAMHPQARLSVLRSWAN